MVSPASAWRAFVRAHDRRTRGEIEAEIDAEIGFHLAEAERDLLARGVDPSRARERALEAFGDVERVRAACRRAQMGGRLMLVRIQWLVIVLLVAAFAATFVRASALQAESRDRERSARAEAEAAREELRKVQAIHQTADVMRHRIEDAGQNARVRVQGEQIEISLPPARAGTGRLDGAEGALRYVIEAPSSRDLGRFALLKCLEAPGSWRHGLSTIEDLVRAHEPRVAADAVAAIYAELPLAQREQVFKPFVFDGGHPHALEILRLGALDQSPSVRERAWHYLRSYAFADFSEDPAAGEAWLERYADQPLEIALKTSAAALSERLATLAGEALDRELRLVADVDVEIARTAGADLAEVVGPARSLELVERWIASRDTNRIVLALQAARAFDLDPESFERIRLALAEHGEDQPPEVWDEFCRAVARPGASWAVEWVVRVAGFRIAEGRSGTALFQAARALAEIGDPSAIPQLLGLLALDDSADQRYAIGYYGLRELTGVAYDDSHGIDWWRAWWAENSRRFPGAPAEIPDLSASFLRK